MRLLFLDSQDDLLGVDGARPSWLGGGAVEVAVEADIFEADLLDVEVLGATL